MKMNKQLILRLLLVAGVIGIFVFFNRPTDTGPAAPEVLGSTKEASSIAIPKIGITAPLVFDELTDSESVVAALKKGVVHFTGTALPGEVGNSYFFAHSSDTPGSGNPFGEIFKDLPMMAAGDEIEMVYEGKLYIYTVLEIRVIDPLDVSVLDPETEGEEILTLQTSYPVGTAQQRFIVIASIK